MNKQADKQDVAVGDLIVHNSICITAVVYTQNDPECTILHVIFFLKIRQNVQGHTLHEETTHHGCMLVICS